jgi:hypothetical protein
MGQDAGMRMLLPVGRSGYAIIAGYLGLFSLLVFPAPLALIFGVLAVLHIKRDPTKHGMGRAIFAIVMGVLGTVLLGFYFLATRTRAVFGIVMGVLGTGLLGFEFLAMRA